MKNYCEKCKYVSWIATKDGTTISPLHTRKQTSIIGGACNHPKALEFYARKTTFMGIPESKPYWCPGMEKAKK